MLLLVQLGACSSYIKLSENLQSNLLLDNNYYHSKTKSTLTKNLPFHNQACHPVPVLFYLQVSQDLGLG